MSSKAKTMGASRRHIPQHRKEPSWTAGGLAVPSGLGAKIVVAGMAGATLAVPALAGFSEGPELSEIATTLLPTLRRASSSFLSRVPDNKSIVLRRSQQAWTRSGWSEKMQMKHFGTKP